MVSAVRRPRMVLGRLVGRVVPAGLRGLPPRGLPLGLAGPAVPGRTLAAGCSGGSSPAAGPLAAAGHACPSPRPVAERTPSDHQRRRMMPGKFRMACCRRGASQCSAPHRDVYAGSTAITARPALAVIWTRRSRSFPVGMPATMRRNAFPRRPREGRVPCRSRPSARASAKSRSSITMARAPCWRAVAIRPVTAARSLPSRVAAGSPASSSGDRERRPGHVPVAGEHGDGEMTRVHVDCDHGMRGEARSRDGPGAGAVFQLASRYHLPDSGSRLMSYRTAPVAACAATSSAPVSKLQRGTTAGTGRAAGSPGAPAGRAA